MKVKNLKIKIEFTDKSGKEVILTLNEYDYLEFEKKLGYHRTSSKNSEILEVFLNGQERVKIKAWKGMENYNNLVQGKTL